PEGTGGSVSGVICTACGGENRDGAKFCRVCGASLAATCPNGHAVEPTDRFCDTCGAVVGPGAPSDAESAPVSSQPTSERRLVSVLFADLVGFTALSESRDPEEVRELLSRYFETCRTV